MKEEKQVGYRDIFIASGVLALLVTICMLFSKTLAGNGEKSVSDNVDKLQSTEDV